MKEKEKKGFLSRLLFAEPKAGCCNVQFEEVDDKSDSSENHSDNESVNKGEMEQPSTK